MTACWAAACKASKGSTGGRTGHPQPCPACCLPALCLQPCVCRPPTTAGQRPGGPNRLLTYTPHFCVVPGEGACAPAMGASGCSPPASSSAALMLGVRRGSKGSGVCSASSCWAHRVARRVGGAGERECVCVCGWVGGVGGWGGHVQQPRARGGLHQGRAENRQGCPHPRPCRRRNPACQPSATPEAGWPACATTPGRAPARRTCSETPGSGATM